MVKTIENIDWRSVRYSCPETYPKVNGLYLVKNCGLKRCTVEAIDSICDDDCYSKYNLALALHWEVDIVDDYDEFYPVNRKTGINLSPHDFKTVDLSNSDTWPPENTLVFLRDRLGLQRAHIKQESGHKNVLHWKISYLKGEPEYDFQFTPAIDSDSYVLIAD